MIVIIDYLIRIMRRYSRLALNNQYIMKPGNTFWAKADDGFLRYGEIKDSPGNACFLGELDGKEAFDPRLFVRINTLAHLGDYLLSLMCLKERREETRCLKYIESVKEFLLSASEDELIDLPGISPLNVMKVLESAYIIGRMFELELSQRCIELALKLQPRVTLWDEDATLGKRKHGKLNYNDVCHGGDALMWFLLGGRDEMAENLWKTRLQSMPEKLKKEAVSLFMSFMGELTLDAVGHTKKNPMETERALLDLQLFWLHCLGISRTCEVRISKLIISELLFESTNTGSMPSIENLMNRLKPDSIRSRYDRISVNPQRGPIREESSANRNPIQINESNSEAEKQDLKRMEAARTRTPELVPYYDLRGDKKSLSSLHRIVKDPRMRSVLIKSDRDKSWHDIFESNGLNCETFVGYVRRVLQDGNGDYTIELKTIEDIASNDDSCWYALGAKCCNTGSEMFSEIEKYEAFIPGRIVNVVYIVAGQEKVMDDLIVDLRVECSVMIEKDFR